MSLKKFVVLSSVISAVLFVSDAKAQVAVYFPYTAVDPMTAIASAPLTLSVKRYANGTPIASLPTPDTFDTTVSGKDTDEYGIPNTNPVQKVKLTTITLACTAVNVRYAPTSGPNLRGIQPDGNTIWDFVYTGLIWQNYWPSAPSEIPAKVYANKYRVSDGDIVAQVKDVAIDVIQTVKIPAIPQILP